MCISSTTHALTSNIVLYLQNRNLQKTISMASSSSHIVICPSAGIGHLTPFLRLTSLLSHSLSSKLTLVLIRPSLSAAESAVITAFLSDNPNVSTSEFHALPPDSDSGDPFLLQYDAVSRSSGHLANHLVSNLSPPPSAVFSDLFLSAGLNETLASFNIPNFTVITSSAMFFSLMVSLPRVLTLDHDRGGRIEISGLGPILEEDVPPVFFDSDHLFRRLIDVNCASLKGCKGILVNTYDFLESKSIEALASRKVIVDLPPFFPIGPLRPQDVDAEKDYPWLDGKPRESVVYISFGSRTTLGRNQIMEVAAALERTSVRFMWVVKMAIVDKEDNVDVRELLGEGFLEKTKERGVVVRDWVNQARILAHPSVGGFVTHCGWNSVMEAAHTRVPVLAWPQHGDQRVNAQVVERIGLGIWERGWGWGGSRLVKGEEIAGKIDELMSSEKLRESATKVGEEARKAWEVEGSSSQMFSRIIEVCEG